MRGRGSRSVPLQRAGVSDETIKDFGEETARDLVAEIRSDAIE
jgi:hypothetical protein